MLFLLHRLSLLYEITDINLSYGKQYSVFKYIGQIDYSESVAQYI